MHFYLIINILINVQLTFRTFYRSKTIISYSWVIRFLNIVNKLKFGLRFSVVELY